MINTRRLSIDGAVVQAGDTTNTGVLVLGRGSQLLSGYYVQDSDGSAPVIACILNGSSVLSSASRDGQVRGTCDIRAGLAQSTASDLWKCDVSVWSATFEPRGAVVAGDVILMLPSSVLQLSLSPDSPGPELHVVGSAVLAGTLSLRLGSDFFDSKANASFQVGELKTTFFCPLACIFIAFVILPPFAF